MMIQTELYRNTANYKTLCSNVTVIAAARLIAIQTREQLLESPKIGFLY